MLCSNMFHNKFLDIDRKEYLGGDILLQSFSLLGYNKLECRCFTDVGTKNPEQLGIMNTKRSYDSGKYSILSIGFRYFTLRMDTRAVFEEHLGDPVRVCDLV